MASPSYIIVGAGNFGSATALELISRDPSADVRLIDTAPLPNPRAASHDINKIIRPDYADLDYTKLMMEAMPHWRDSDLYKPYYHEVGVVRIDESDFSDRVLQNYKSLYPDEKDIPGRWLSRAETQALANGVLQDVDFGGLDRAFFNFKSGWAAAEKGLTAVSKAAVAAGVKYLSTGVRKLLIDEEKGECTGVLLENGEHLTADKILLAAGAQSAVLLASSAPSSDKIQAGDRLVAAGAVSFYIKLDEEQKKRFENAPVVKNCEPSTKGESMGMTPDGTLKFNCDVSFTNMGIHPVTGKEMSIPPTSKEETSWTPGYFPSELRARSQKVLKGSYGRLVDGLEIQEYRMCWDAVTPHHDFLICAHPHCSKLYVASGGSFHGWKFLPIIGKYIVRALDGTLDGPIAKRWAWDRDPNDHRAANPTYQIETDLQKLKREDEDREAGKKNGHA